MDNSNPPSRRASSALIFNLLTVLMLMGICVVLGYFVIVFNNPQSLINPYRPIIIPTIPPTPTITNTPIQLPPTFTPVPTRTPQPTDTPNPSATPLPTFTPFTLFTPVPGEETPTPESKYPYLVQAGNPIQVQNVTHPELGCEWMGVGGQAIDQNGAPIVGLVVQLGGTLGGFTQDMLTLTGSAAQFGYGPGGYEFKLGDGPVASNDSLYVQLLDQEGLPLSDKIFFDTSADCEKVLILVNFVAQE